MMSLKIKFILMRCSILDVTLTAFETYLLLQSSYSLQKTCTQLNVRDCLEWDIKRYLSDEISTENIKLWILKLLLDSAYQFRIRYMRTTCKIEIRDRANRTELVRTWKSNSGKNELLKHCEEISQKSNELETLGKEFTCYLR